MVRQASSQSMPEVAMPNQEASGNQHTRYNFSNVEKLVPLSVLRCCTATGVSAYRLLFVLAAIAAFQGLLTITVLHRRMLSPEEEQASNALRFFEESHSVKVGNSTNGPDVKQAVVSSSANSSLASQEIQQKPRQRQLDIYVAGFPKCGTTTLQHIFAVHPETAMSKDEECSLGRSKLVPALTARRNVWRHLRHLTRDHTLKRGIKCPIGIKNRGGIAQIREHFPEAKLIVGIRHPVKYFESYYNYRIKENYQQRNTTEYEPDPPPIESLIEYEWKEVCTYGARYEKYLRRLGKTNMEGYLPTPSKVFLYTLEQMEDTDERRQEVFRDELKKFLNLTQPIPALPRANANKQQTQDRLEGTVDICDIKYEDLRGELVANGEITQQWMLDEFIKSPDVTVANEDHFRELLQEWGSDPCVGEKSGNSMVPKRK